MSNNASAKNEPAITCDPQAVPADQREHWVEIGRRVYTAVEQVQELPDGYRFRLPAGSEMLQQLAEYMANERLCCAFLRFTLELEPAGGPFWLQLTGGPGVKEYIGSILTGNELLEPGVAKAARLG